MRKGKTHSHVLCPAGGRTDARTPQTVVFCVRRALQPEPKRATSRVTNAQHTKQSIRVHNIYIRLIQPLKNTPIICYTRRSVMRSYYVIDLCCREIVDISLNECIDREAFNRSIVFKRVAILFCKHSEIV